jgi:hypothetical protein
MQNIKAISLVTGLVIGSVGVLVFLANPAVGSAIMVGAVAGVCLANEFID